MFSSPTIKTLARKSALCFALTAMAFLTFASSGGGGDKSSKSIPMTNQFTPIRTTGGFTLKSGPVYRGSNLLNSQKQKDGAVTFNSVVTYKRGNTTFILPYKYKMNMPARSCNKTNLNAVDIKIPLRK
jgi:hypothetical protein